MNELEKIRVWHALKDQIGKIYDYKTRSVYYKAFLARACSQWGFNPEKPGQPIQNESVELDDWEKEFVEDIKDSITFGFNVRKQKQNREFIETRRNMREFIQQGGTLKDIPENIKSKNIVDIYVKELLFEGAEILELTDFVLNKEQ